jgi:hypothetical protein
MVDERGQQREALKTAPIPPADAAVVSPAQPTVAPANNKPQPREIGGPKGLEPTRYGDWERAGRCIDF